RQEAQTPRPHEPVKGEDGAGLSPMTPQTRPLSGY
ncbi:hypothetical protein LCGC14_1491900, partial [marine sediment metagenome]